MSDALATLATLATLGVGDSRVSEVGKTAAMPKEKSKVELLYY